MIKFYKENKDIEWHFENNKFNCKGPNWI